MLLLTSTSLLVYQPSLNGSRSFSCVFLQLDLDLAMIYVRLLLKFIRYASTPYWAAYIVAMSNFVFSYNWLLISRGLWS